MPPPPPSSKSSKQHEMPSNNLWVGNLSSDMTDADLMDIFGQYGAIDATSYASRSYAFVFFKRVEDATAAKLAMQGKTVKGNSIKIEFARPAKPCKQIWIGGISPTVSVEEIEKEFLKFGKIDDLKFFRERNTALIDYIRLDDACQAMKSMNGKLLGGEHIRVDFLRSQPPRRDNWQDANDSRDYLVKGMGLTDVHVGSKRQQLSQPPGARRSEGQPSNVLWVGYPPSVQVDEQMLHNAMILFGEIERIKSFPARHFSFVEFRSVDEARRAKEGLQGRLFNDPRITIMFSNSELAPGREYTGFPPGVRGPRPDMLGEPPFQPPDMYGHGRPMGPGSLPPSGMMGPNMGMRPFGSQGPFDPGLSGPEFEDVDGPYGLQDGNGKGMVGPKWRRPSPTASAVLPSSASGMGTPARVASGSWDVYDASHLQRDAKRSRIEGVVSADESPFPLRMEDHAMGPDHVLGSSIDAGMPFRNLPGGHRLSPLGSRFAHQPPDNDCIWRGIIAKGGTPICHARCVPRGEGLPSDLPEVVNCSARTGLDMLAEHITRAAGFDLVFFLPDSEDDFASYTEFLRYLGSKNRAGVAKLVDGTNLFLVPPSDFLRNVLRVMGPERLYGLVLKVPPQPASDAHVHHQQHQPIPLPHYSDRQQILSHGLDHGLVSPREEQLPQRDYNRVLQEDMNIPQKPLYPPANESATVQSVVQDASTSTAAASKGGVTLTPELIATLATILPASAQVQAQAQAQAQAQVHAQAQAPSVEGDQQNFMRSYPPVTANRESQSQGWREGHLVSDHGGHSAQQSGNQLSSQMLTGLQYNAYPAVSGTSGFPAQGAIGTAQMQDSAANPLQQGFLGPRPLTSYANLSQAGQYVAPAQATPPYQLEVPSNTQKGYGMMPASDVSALYSSPSVQRNNPPAPVNLVQGANFSHPQGVMPSVYDKGNPELPAQAQQLQSAASGTSQGMPDGEVDKNQRYQSTLQFAASLLLQIQQQQQQQQQAGSQTGRGSGN